MKKYFIILTIGAITLLSQTTSATHTTENESFPLQEVIQDNRSIEQTGKKETDIVKQTKQISTKKQDKKKEESSSSSSKTKKTSEIKETTVQPQQEEAVIQKSSSIFNDKQTTLIQTTFVKLINQTRQNPVVISSRLYSSASLRAKEANHKWSHTRPNGSRWNTTLTSIINIKTTPHGENLAKTTINYKNEYTDDEIIHIVTTMHQQLINSSTHYQVMTNQNYKKVNIGIYTQIKDNQVIVIIAQHFTA